MSFDLPGTWWPDQPAVVGGRDRRGGGTWCAVDVAAGVSAVVLNRPDRRVAEPARRAGACCRCWRSASWPTGPTRSELPGMASFNLVLATPSDADLVGLRRPDAEQLRARPPAPTCSPRAAIADGPLADRFAAGDCLPRCRGRCGYRGRLVGLAGGAARRPEPSADPQDLYVRIPIGTDVFETVFGQFIASRPGALRLDHLPGRPAVADGRERWTGCRSRWQPSRTRIAAPWPDGGIIQHMAVLTAIEDPELPPHSECWCCGRIEQPDRLVHLGNHPEVAVCIRCAYSLKTWARAIEDRDRAGSAVRLRDLLRHARRP